MAAQPRGRDRRVTGRPGADVGVADAWRHATGEGVVIAVVDTGADISPPALAGRLWVNPGERVDGRDTDGNGFVDDVHGWNFVDGDARLFHSEATDAHGTHVAGVIVGAHHPRSGAMGAPPPLRCDGGSTRRPGDGVRFIDGDAGRTSAAIAAIRYAAANGADVINAS